MSLTQAAIILLAATLALTVEATIGTTATIILCIASVLLVIIDSPIITSRR